MLWFVITAIIVAIVIIVALLFILELPEVKERIYENQIEHFIQQIEDIGNVRMSATEKGTCGESVVHILIGNTIPDVRYVINDLVLRTGEQKSSQIDHVVIQSNGIFVIETKFYSGRIYGSQEQREWTQVLNYGKTKNKIYNPLLQNKTHVYHIAQLLSHKYSITPVVVFVKGNIQYIDAEGVYSLRGLREILESGEEVLTAEQMEDAYQTLMAAHDSTITTREHVKHIRMQQTAIDNNICPRCGKELVLRQGKSGAFYGCKGYPDCKFTKKCTYSF